MVLPRSFLQSISLVCLVLHSTAAVDLSWHENREGAAVFDQDVTLNEKDEFNVENSDVLAKKTSVWFAVPFKTSSIPSAIFDKVPGLESLELAGVGLTTLNGNDYENAKSLKRLQIEKASIPVLKAHSFSTAETLQELRLIENGITKIETEAFDGLNELKTLQLTSNKIVDLNLMDFAKLPKLNNLIVSIAGFTFTSTYDPDEVAKVVAYNSSVTILDLSYNLVDSPDLFKRLAIFPNLRNVYLTHNRITRLDNFEELKQFLPNLELIQGDGNPYDHKWLEEAKEYFANNYPDITFVYQ